jgi:hypothetical protein
MDAEKALAAIMERLDKLERRGAAAPAAPEIKKMPADVTVAMIVASDVSTSSQQMPSRFWAQTLFMLEAGGQDLPLRILIQPVEPDQDGINALLRDLGDHPEKWPVRAFPAGFTVLAPIPSHGNANKNIEHGLAVMMANVDTPYVMFVEPDTEPQPGVVFDLMKTLESDETIGFVGCGYERETDHPKLGCSMMRTELAKDIKWRSDGGCVCRWLHKTEMPRRELKSVYLKDGHRFARHWRRVT